MYIFVSNLQIGKVMQLVMAKPVFQPRVSGYSALSELHTVMPLIKIVTFFFELTMSWVYCIH